MREYASSEQIRHNYADNIRRMTDEEIANLCLTLTHLAIYMLHKLLITMQQHFVTEGGIKERMFKARMNYRNSQGKNNQSGQSGQSGQYTQSNQNTQSTMTPPKNTQQ
jgi:four helix bundle suffix protein